MTNCCSGSSNFIFMVYFNINIHSFNFYVTFPPSSPKHRLKYDEICGYIKIFGFLKHSSKSRYRSLTQRVLRHVDLDILIQNQAIREYYTQKLKKKYKITYINYMNIFKIKST